MSGYPSASGDENASAQTGVYSAPGLNRHEADEEECDLCKESKDNCNRYANGGDPIRQAPSTFPCWFEEKEAPQLDGG